MHNPILTCFSQCQMILACKTQSLLILILRQSTHKVYTLLLLTEHQLKIVSIEKCMLTYHDHDIVAVVRSFEFVLPGSRRSSHLGHTRSTIHNRDCWPRSRSEPWKYRVKPLWGRAYWAEQNRTDPQPCRLDMLLLTFSTMKTNTAQYAAFINTSRPFSLWTLYIAHM